MLKHPFIKGAKQNSILKELIARHDIWLAEQSQLNEFTNEDESEEFGQVSDPWDFGTVKERKPPPTKDLAAIPPKNIKVPPPPPLSTRPDPELKKNVIETAFGTTLKTFSDRITVAQSNDILRVFKEIETVRFELIRQNQAYLQL